MMDPIAEVRVPIRLDNKDRVMIFNANTMCSFEQVTGKFFLSTVADLYSAIYPKEDEKDYENLDPTPKKLSGLDVLKKVSMQDLRALLWASLHEYDAKDNPVWPLTLNQVGRIMQVRDIMPVFTAFLKGQVGNSPSKDEMGESQAEGKSNGMASPQTTADNGGERGIELPAGAFD